MKQAITIFFSPSSPGVSLGPSASTLRLRFPASTVARLGTDIGVSARTDIDIFGTVADAVAITVAVSVPALAASSPAPRKSAAHAGVFGVVRLAGRGEDRACDSWMWILSCGALGWVGEERCDGIVGMGIKGEEEGKWCVEKGESWEGICRRGGGRVGSGGIERGGGGVDVELVPRVEWTCWRLARSMSKPIDPNSEAWLGTDAEDADADADADADDPPGPKAAATSPRYVGGLTHPGGNGATRSGGTWICEKSCRAASSARASYSNGTGAWTGVRCCRGSVWLDGAGPRTFECQPEKPK